MSELVLWLRADTGTDGSAVGFWQDQSGRSNHVSQTVATNKPHKC